MKGKSASTQMGSEQRWLIFRLGVRRLPCSKSWEKIYPSRNIYNRAPQQFLKYIFKYYDFSDVFKTYSLKFFLQDDYSKLENEKTSIVDENQAKNCHRLQNIPNEINLTIAKATIKNSKT